MKYLLYAAGALAWAALVFVVTFWMTFPSDTLAERLRYEVPERLGEGWVAEIGSVSPWWAGLSVADVKLFNEPAPERTSTRFRPRSANEDDGALDDGEAVTEEGEGAEPADDLGPRLVAVLQSVSVRLDPLRSLLARSPHVSGVITPTEGEIWFSIGTGQGKRSDVSLTDLSVRADDVALADLAAAMGATGDGKIDLVADLTSGENGLRDASGRAELTGSGLTLSDLEFPTIGPIGMELPISDLRVIVDVVSGKGTITEGRMVSDLVTVVIAGEITIRDPIDRSAFDVTFTLSDLGEQLTPFQGLMSGAKQSDGTYQYNCRGVFTRITPTACSTRDRSRATSSRSTPTVGAPTSRVPQTDEEREARREEIRERLRQRKEEREALKGAPPPVQVDGEPVDDLGDEPIIEEEELDVDDLPVEEE